MLELSSNAFKGPFKSIFQFKRGVDLNIEPNASFVHIYDKL